jgi:hypothetical protein
MAISSTRRRSRAVPAVSVAPEPDLPAEPLPIGLPDLDVTSCPICARPIAVGTGKCPGCGTRLLLGVPARRAGAFVILGLVVGLTVGAGSAAIVVGRGSGSGNARPGGGPVPSVPAASPASAAPSIPRSNPPSAPPPSSAVPAHAGAALGQVLSVNDRLASRAAALRAGLAAKPFDAFTVATTLRALSADAVVGDGVTGLIAEWPSGADLSARLSAYYRRVGTTAATALGSSLGDTAAYRAGALQMIRVLGDLAPLDADAESLATEAGVAVPSSTAPGP